MIPWMKDKISRAKWIASRKREPNPPAVTDGPISPGVSGSSPHQNSNLNDFKNSKLRPTPESSTSSSLVKDNSHHHDNKEKIKIRIISPNSRMIQLTVNRNKTLIDIKHEALIELSEDSGALPLVSTDIHTLIPKYRFIRPDCHSTGSSTSIINGTNGSNAASSSNIMTTCNHGYLNESLTLAQLDINNNDTLILSVRRTKITPKRGISDLHAPRSDEIAAATHNIVPNALREPQRVDVNELVLQTDIQFDVRKVIISLAQQSAYIIGSGPYAKRLIAMLKQRLVNKRKHQSDTLQCLVDMGFPRDKAAYSLKINNGIYLSALEWLIHHQNEPIPLHAASDSQMSSSAIAQKIPVPNTVAENIEALLEIVRIYGHRDITPSAENLAALIDMGFREADVRDALKRTHNNQAAAAEYLCGYRSESLMELREGLSRESPILKVMMESPQVQASLSNPKIFIAYLSMLENQNALSMWLGDAETSSVISHILRKYHEEKHALGINQFNMPTNTVATR